MRVLWLSIVVLLIDQATKVAVKFAMFEGQTVPLLGDWLKLRYSTNPGIAFGIEIGPPGTVAVLALLATLLIAAYLWQVRHVLLPYRVSLALILGGAVGNVIDRVAYGVIFGEGSWFTGRVVDFIYVSVWQGFVPPWVPRIGGAYLDLLPIWNVADMAVVVGFVGVVIFQGRLYQNERRRAAPSEAVSGAASDASPEAASDLELPNADAIDSERAGGDAGNG